MPQASQAFSLFLNRDVETELPSPMAAGQARYLVINGPEVFVNQSGKLSNAEVGDAAIRLEPIRHKDQNLLLLSAGPRARVTINAARINRLATLNPGDVLSIDGLILHVSLLNCPYFGPPDETALAAACGFCRVPIQNETGMRIYVCPNCGLPTHAQREDVAVEKRLECDRLCSQCGHCQAEIVHTEGFSHVPVL